MTSPLPLSRLHHIARVTADAEASINFYCDVLGFEKLPRPPFSFRGAWLYGYNVQIHIIENATLGDADRGKIDTRADHLAFSASDMDRVKELLAERGISFEEQVNAGGIHQVFFHDPDGHHIEISLTGDPSIGYTGENAS